MTLAAILLGRVREVEHLRVQEQAGVWESASARLVSGMRRISLRTISVSRRPNRRSQGWLRAGSLIVPVALGRAGVKADKHEGDGGTPRGRFHPVRVWWRADLLRRPRTLLPARRIGRADAWCEDPGDRRYNQSFHRSANEPGDRLWRDDRLYDVLLELDHNTRPRVAGRGSAVFVHVARPGFAPTAGCVGLRLHDLRALLSRISRKTRIEIHN
jgi:L,D-peptidoglycan transpeptidase YkuD (ErfK/YbiS/YcfS/YnhG family)